MSYFFGTTGSSGTLNTGRKKHARHQSLSNDREIEPVHGLKHRRKHIASKKYILKPKSLHKESFNKRCEHDNPLSKSRSKRCSHKEIARLVEENRLLSAKLKGTELDLDNLSVVKDRDELLSQLRKKYKKLEKSFCKMQVNRDKIHILLAQRENEYRQLHIQHEESRLIIKNFEQERNNFITTIQKFKNENFQLNEDVSLLKNLVYLLNIEIENYQDKLRTHGHTAENLTVVNIIDEVKVDFENKNVLKAWGRVNFHALGPLLDAYQENINEKDELIKKYKMQLDNFTGRVKEVIAENENLHIEIENLKLKYDKYVNEMKFLENDTSTLKEKNDLVTKQSNLQKQKMQEIHVIYKQKVELMSQENNKLHKEYVACKTELSNLKGRYEILHEGYELLKSNSEKTMAISVHNTAVEECKRLFEELKQQYESEKKKLNIQIKHMEEMQPENEKQLITLMAERDQLRIQTKNLEKCLKRTQYKLEHLQSTIHSIQVSRDSFKRQLSKTTSYCEELVKEQEKLITEKNKLVHLLEKREKENEDIQYLGSNIVYRMGTLKNQLKIVQEGAKEQLASVEKHIKNQELGVDQIKTDYRRELQRLKQLLQQKEEIIKKLQMEKCATQENFDLVWKAAVSDDRNVKNAFKNANIYNV